MKHPEMIAIDGAVERLQGRLNQLLRESALSDSLSGKIAGWIEGLDLPWLEHSKPFDLDDPRIGDLDEAMDEGVSGFGSLERVKFHSLVATQSDLPLGQKWEATRQFLFGLLDTTDSLTEKHRLIRSLLELEGVPESIRATLIWTGAARAADVDRRRLSPASGKRGTFTVTPFPFFGARSLT